MLCTHWPLGKSFKKSSEKKAESKTKPEPPLHTSLDERSFWCGPKGPLERSCSSATLVWIRLKSAMVKEWTCLKNPENVRSYRLWSEPRLLKGWRSQLRGQIAQGLGRSRRRSSICKINSSWEKISTTSLWISFLPSDISIAAKEFNYKEFVPTETIECLRRNPWSGWVFLEAKSLS